jgi:UDP-2,3-diacylglucosamine pyrophosphatase LpxH
MWGALVCANDWSVSEPAYERALANEAPRRGVDGAICGHIHHAVINAMSNLCHINCGDWVESCTAVVEHFDGSFEITRAGPAVRSVAAV